MPMIQIEQDSPEVLDSARALIVAMAGELRKIAARGGEDARLAMARETAGVTGYLNALHQHGLVSGGMFTTLLTEKGAAQAEARPPRYE